jgi:hypothetical protein
MTRLIVLLVGALLSPISQAKHLPKKIKGDSTHLYQWVSDYCDGTPYGYNANLYMQRDKCVSLEARSVRPRFDAERKQWLQLVNTGTLQCKLLMWNNPGCVGDYNAIMDVPEDFDKCYTTPEHFPKRSGKFTCGRNIVDGLGYVHLSMLQAYVVGVLTFHNRAENETKPTPGTHTISAVSWAIGDGEIVTPVATTHTVTVQAIRPVPVTSTHTIAVVASAAASALEPRGRYRNDFWGPDYEDNESFDINDLQFRPAPTAAWRTLNGRGRYHNDIRGSDNPVHKAVEPVPSADLESRSKYDKETKVQIANVWMYHPWTRSIICYECFTQEAHIWGTTKCYSKREGPYYCGPKPVDVWGNPLTTMKTVVLNGTARTASTSTTELTEPATIVVKTTVFVTAGADVSTAETEFGLGVPTTQTGTTAGESQTIVEGIPSASTTEGYSSTLQDNTAVAQPTTSTVRTETIVLPSQTTTLQSDTSVESESTVVDPIITIIEGLPPVPTTHDIFVTTVVAHTTVTQFLPPVTVTAAPAPTAPAPAPTSLETTSFPSDVTPMTAMPLESTPSTPSPSLPSASQPLDPNQPRLFPRSWHKSVHLRLPWNNMRMCADAEWESRGKPDTEIRIQKVFVDSGDSCRGAQSIDLRV